MPRARPLYALHVSGSVPANDPVYQKGVQWLLRNQLARRVVVRTDTRRAGSALHVRELPTAGINLSRMLLRAGQRCHYSLLCRQASLEQLISSNLSRRRVRRRPVLGSWAPRIGGEGSCPGTQRSVIYCETPGPNVSIRPKRGAAHVRAFYGIALGSLLLRPVHRCLRRRVEAHSRTGSPTCSSACDTPRAVVLNS